MPSLVTVRPWVVVMRTDQAMGAFLAWVHLGILTVSASPSSEASAPDLLKVLPSVE